MIRSRKRGAPPVSTSSRKIDRLAVTFDHDGIVARTVSGSSDMSWVEGPPGARQGLP